MNVSNLEVGKLYKKYGEICNALGEKEKTGNSKIAQIKEWERYFAYEKKGHKWIIKEIYKIPLAENNSFVSYEKIMQDLLMNMIVKGTKEGDNTVYLSKNNLLKTLHMVNKEYGNMKIHKRQLSIKNDIPIETVADFYKTSGRMLKGNVEGALNKLKSRNLITWNNVFTVAKMDTDNTKTYEDEDRIKVNEECDIYGDKEIKLEKEKGKAFSIHRQATERETEIIIGYQYDVMYDMGYTEMQEVFKANRSEEFYNRVTELLRDNHNIERYYQSYFLIFKREHLIEANADISYFMLDDEAKKAMEDELNSEVIKKIMKNAGIRHERAKSGIGSNTVIRKEERYILDIEALSSLLIKSMN